MGQQYPALETYWKLWAKVPAEFRNYEEDFFFCKCSASSDPVEFSAYLATAIHQMLPARDARFCVPENWALQPELNSKATCPTGRSLPACTAGSSITHIAGATKSPHLFFLFFPRPQCQCLLGLFSQHPAPHPAVSCTCPQ